MRNQYKILQEVYKGVVKEDISQETLEAREGNLKTLTPVRGTYLYFVNEDELYQLNPYRQVQPQGMIMTLATNWRMARVIQGEDARELGYQITNPAQWYEASPDTAPDHVHDVYIGG